MAKSPEDNVKEAIKGRHDKLKHDDGSEYDNPVKKTLKAEKTKLETLFAEYDRLSVPCKLDQLSSAYNDATIRQNLHDAYNRDSKQMSDLWDNVAIDAEGKAIICPYCHSTIVTDLDHYVPRKEMPEYSVCLHNLIPLCHQCNLDKHDGWKDGSGKRIFFSAYYDDVPALDEYLDLTIVISADTNTPKAVVDMKPFEAGDSESVRLTKSTIEALKLVSKYWQKTANDEMKTLVRRFTSDFKTASRRRGISRSDFWDEQKETLQDEISDMTDNDFITKLVYEKVVSSDVFQNWMLYG